MLGLGRDNLHSTLVVWLKILLPLAALAVLSTLFMVSHHVNPEDAIPYADVNVEDRLREPRLTGATFAGMTQDGAAVTLKAAEATPSVAGSTTPGQAKGLAGRIETPDGVQTNVTSPLGQLDQAAKVVTLSGGVNLQNSAGYTMQTDSLTLALDRTRLESAGTVTSTAPFGRITAGKLLMTRADDGTHKLDFTGGVRLIYQPGTPG
jgi:lipopolysaccharide export system protein LptC